MSDGVSLPTYQPGKSDGWALLIVQLLRQVKFNRRASFLGFFDTLTSTRASLSSRDRVSNSRIAVFHEMIFVEGRGIFGR